MEEYFNKVTEQQEILVKVIAQRFELNDQYVSITGELMEPN
jgi:hypothetical protein